MDDASNHPQCALGDLKSRPRTGAAYRPLSVGQRGRNAVLSGIPHSAEGPTGPYSRPSFTVISELSLVSKDWFLSGTGCFLGVELQPLQPCLCSELSAKLLTGSQASQTHREHRELGTGGMGRGCFGSPQSLQYKAREWDLRRRRGLLQGTASSKAPPWSPHHHHPLPGGSSQGWTETEAAAWNLTAGGSHPRSGVCRCHP